MTETEFTELGLSIKKIKSEKNFIVPEETNILTKNNIYYL